MQWLYKRTGLARLAFAAMFAQLLCMSVQARQIQAVTELFYPYQMVDEQDELTGYSIELVRALAEKTGDQIDIDMMPWTKAYNIAQSRPNTLIFSIRRNDDREELFNWIGDIALERLYFWRLSTNNIPSFDHFEPYKRYRFAIVKDATTHQFLRQNDFQQLYVMSGAESNEDERVRIRMLVNNRADLMIASNRAIKWSLDKLGYDDDFLTPVYRAEPLEGALYLAFSKPSDPELIKTYRTALKELMESPAGMTLKHRWEIDDFQK